MAKPGLRKVFEQFRVECIAIRRDYNTFCALYESGDRSSRLMQASAPAFFRDMNEILIKHLYSRICAITDPAETRVRGKVRENLTVELLNKRLATRMTPEIARLSAKLQRHREKIKKARDKFLSHIDVIHAFRTKAVGAHGEREVAAFFVALQDYCDAVGRISGAGPLDFSSMPEDGDVHDLLRVIEAAVGRRRSRG